MYAAMLKMKSAPGHFVHSRLKDDKGCFRVVESDKRNSNYVRLDGSKYDSYHIADLEPCNCRNEIILRRFSEKN